MLNQFALTQRSDRDERARDLVKASESGQVVLASRTVQV